MKNCEECQSLIDMYLEDELTKDVKMRFSAHISSCDECKSALEFAQNVKETLADMPDFELPDDFTKGVRARVTAERKRTHKTGTYFVRYGSLAACLILAVVIARGIETPNYNKSDDILYNYSITAPKAVDNGQEYAGEETPTPTKEKTAEQAPKNKAVTAPKTTAQPASDNVLAEPVTESEEAYGTQMASLYDVDTEISYDTFTAENSVSESIEEQSASGGADGNSKARILTAEPIALSVTAEQFDKARTVIAEYTALVDGVYSATHDGFSEILAKLSEEGIEYTQIGEAGEDNVKFVLKVI